MKNIAILVFLVSILMTACQGDDNFPSESQLIGEWKASDHELVLYGDHQYVRTVTFDLPNMNPYLATVTSVQTTLSGQWSYQNQTLTFESAVLDSLFDYVPLEETPRTEDGVSMAYYYGADSSYATSSDYQEATSSLGSLWINTEPNSTKVLLATPQQLQLQYEDNTTHYTRKK